MGIWRKQKKVLTAFGIFLVLMYLCTLISRAVYASKLPQVTVDAPRRMALDHTVEAEGIVHQGREYAVTALTGLRVRTVYANVGDHVEPETLLFDLDLEDLQEKIGDKELEIKKLQLQIAAMEQNKSLDIQKQQMESSRAQEDYSRTEEKSEEALTRAREDLEKAEDAYEDHKEHPVEMTSSEERQTQQKVYDAWVQKETELKEALEDAKKACEAAEETVKRLEAEKKVSSEETDQNITAGDTDVSAEAGEPDSAADESEKEDPEWKAAQEAALEAKGRLEAAEAVYDAHLKEKVEKPDYSEEDAEKSAWNSKKESLKDEIESAERAVEDAERAQSDAILEEERKVEDAGMTANADSSLAVGRLELSALQKELAAYKKVQDASGQVYPEAEGIVTRIQVSPGERVGDGAAFVYADLSSPMQFQVSLTKEQKKYVNQGDTVNLALGGSSAEELKVDYVAENEMNPELYDARVFLPDGVGTIGQSGKFRVEAQSETFSCCIPVNALHIDSNQRSFVYIVSERSGILGTELIAEQVYVKVLDQNGSFAAVEEGVIDQETELILSSTEELEDRDVVRYKE